MGIAVAVDSGQIRLSPILGHRRSRRESRETTTSRSLCSGAEPNWEENSHEFCKRLTFVTLIASLLFVLCLPILLSDFYRATFKFFCVVYGFLLLVHLVRISIAQNISIARLND